MQHVKGGICAPQGFLAAGVSANVKGKGGDKKDIAIIMSSVPAAAAGVFTTNCVQAAPVVISKQILKQGQLQAIVINSGNANACTGKQGLADAEKMCAQAAQALGIAKEQVAVASTGVIGVPLPMERILPGIMDAAASISDKGAYNAALAIMTTDTSSKEIAVQIVIGGKTVTLGGVAKGSGMVHPNMATILGFVTSDANISTEVLQKALSMVNEKSFNMITVDGDTSTNDMILAMANGLAENEEIVCGTADFAIFVSALEEILVSLAKMIASDGEGATKLLEVLVVGAATMTDARLAAKAVCRSMLVKTALFASDPNWGRILCAMGYSGAQFDPALVDLYIGEIQVMNKGGCLPFDEGLASKVLAQKEVVITADLNGGAAMAKAWGCDLSYDYVKINGAYRS